MRNRKKSLRFLKTAKLEKVVEEGRRILRFDKAGKSSGKVDE
jgi:hypothetical protein